MFLQVNRHWCAALTPMLVFFLFGVCFVEGNHDEAPMDDIAEENSESRFLRSDREAARVVEEADEIESVVKRHHQQFHEQFQSRPHRGKTEARSDRSLAETRVNAAAAPDLLHVNHHGTHRRGGNPDQKDLDMLRELASELGNTSNGNELAAMKTSDGSQSAFEGLRLLLERYAVISRYAAPSFVIVICGVFIILALRVVMPSLWVLSSIQRLKMTDPIEKRGTKSTKTSDDKAANSIRNICWGGPTGVDQVDDDGDGEPERRRNFRCSSASEEGHPGAASSNWPLLRTLRTVDQLRATSASAGTTSVTESWFRSGKAHHLPHSTAPMVLTTPAKSSSLPVKKAAPRPELTGIGEGPSRDLAGDQLQPSPGISKFRLSKLSLQIAAASIIQRAFRHRRRCTARNAADSHHNSRRRQLQERQKVVVGFKDISAMGLPNVSSFGGCDPMIEFRASVGEEPLDVKALLPTFSVCTHKKENDRNPKWDQTLFLYGLSKRYDALLHIIIWDCGLYENVPIGHCTVRLADIVGTLRKDLHGVKTFGPFRSCLPGWAPDLQVCVSALICIQELQHWRVHINSNPCLPKDVHDLGCIGAEMELKIRLRVFNYRPVASGAAQERVRSNIKDTDYDVLWTERVRCSLKDGDQRTDFIEDFELDLPSAFEGCAELIMTGKRFSSMEVPIANASVDFKDWLNLGGCGGKGLAEQATWRLNFKWNDDMDCTEKASAALQIIRTIAFDTS